MSSVQCYFRRSELERKGFVFSEEISAAGDIFMRSRFMRSLKKESMEPMDGALFAPHPASVPAGWNQHGTDGNAWERKKCSIDKCYGDPGKSVKEDPAEQCRRNLMCGTS
jgi:hypothetical protein